MPKQVIILLASIMAFAGVSPKTLWSDEFFERCGTPGIVRLMAAGASKIAAGRLDNLAKSAVSSQGHFRVHYDVTGYNAPSATDADMNGIPDYVDSTLIYLEYAWDLEINTLGFKAPSPDKGAGGGDEIDIYVKNFGNGGYGITYPEKYTDGTTSAYFIIDNNYTESQYAAKSFAALRVTTAHEFFHVIQFSYGVNSTILIWWMEQTATWMEERAWGDVNDYIAYLRHFYLYQNKYPIDHISLGDNFMYGAVVFPLYLAKRFGDDIIKKLWDAIISDRNSSISSFDRIIPGGLGAAINEFGIWNYFTAEKADTEAFFPDGSRFGYTVSVDSNMNDYPASQSVSTVNLSSNYLECYFAGKWSEYDALHIDFSATSGRVHENSVVLFNSPSDYRIDRIITSGTSVGLGKQWDRAVIVTSCVNTAAPGGSFQLTLDRDVDVSVVENRPPSFEVRGAQPNPFNAATTIRFTMPRAGHAAIHVHDILGRRVGTLLDTNISAGEKAVLWKPENLGAGVYFVRIATSSGEKTIKTMFLK